MSFLDIFSSDTLGKGIDAIRDSGDAMFYTEEEKSRASQLILDSKISILKAFEPFKLAQRYVAFTIVINFFLAFWLGIALFLFVPEYLDGYLKIVGLFNLGWIMLAVVSFYFGGGFMESIKRKV